MPTHFPLGRIVQHDPRSLDFPAATPLPVKTVLHALRAPILDQGHVGSCTGNAMAQALNTDPLFVKALTEKDALRLYSEATRLDNAPGTYPPDDTGSSGLAVAQAAKNEGLITSYAHAFGITHALAALQTGPVICGTNWYSGMFTPDAKGVVKISGTVQGGHEWALIGVDTTAKMLTCLNSWGSGWGDQGKFYLSYATFTRLLKEQGDVTVPLR